MIESAEALRQSLTDLIAESQALRVDVKAAEQARKRENFINLLVTGMLAIFVLMLLGVAYQGNHIADETRKTNAQIADCTTAGGACYEEGRKRTSQAVGDIVQVSIYMAECARLWPGESGPEFDRKLEACVAEKLTKSKEAGK